MLLHCYLFTSRTFINVHYFPALPDISTHFQVDFSKLDPSVLLFSLTSFPLHYLFLFFFLLVDFLYGFCVDPFFVLVVSGAITSDRTYYLQYCYY